MSMQDSSTTKNDEMPVTAEQEAAPAEQEERWLLSPELAKAVEAQLAEVRSSRVRHAMLEKAFMSFWQWLEEEYGMPPWGKAIVDLKTGEVRRRNG